MFCTIYIFFFYFSLASQARRTYRTFRIGARLDRDRDGLLVFFVGVVLFRFAAAANYLADLLVAAAPVVPLAGQFAISRIAPQTSRRGVGQWGGARGAIREDHFGVAICLEGRATSRGAVFVEQPNRVLPVRHRRAAKLVRC